MNWFRNLSRGSQIAVGTLAAHALILLLLVAQHWITLPSHKRKHIAVNTVRISAPPVVTTVTKPTAAIKPTVAAPAKPSPIKPKSTPKAKPISKPITPKKGVQAEPKFDPSLFKEIDQSIASITAPIKEIKKELEVPLLAPVEEVPTESSTAKIAYFLQQSLLLPEFGKVKVHVSIDRFGKLIAFDVLDAKSKKNAEFLKNQLPELSFPCLNETVSLTIVFSNEI